VVAMATQTPPLRSDFFLSCPSTFSYLAVVSSLSMYTPASLLLHRMPGALSCDPNNTCICLLTQHNAFISFFPPIPLQHSFLTFLRTCVQFNSANVRVGAAGDQRRNMCCGRGAVFTFDGTPEGQQLVGISRQDYNCTRRKSWRRRRRKLDVCEWCVVRRTRNRGGG
jgi:hypothetical protein